MIYTTHTMRFNARGKYTGIWYTKQRKAKVKTPKEYHFDMWPPTMEQYIEAFNILNNLVKQPTPCAG